MPGDSKSPFIKMPATSLGDGKYRGNSLGDGKVMRIQSPPAKVPPPKKSKSKPVLKAILHPVAEGHSTNTTLMSDRSKSRIKAKKKHPNVSAVYPKYVYNEKGLPNLTAALYSEQSFDLK